MFEIQLHGPGKNALSAAMMTTLLAQLAEAAGRPVLIHGHGDAFSAGLDLREVAAFDAHGMAAHLALLDRFFTAFYQYPGPMVAAVNGHAIAGGCVLALCADYRIGPRSARARIGLNEVALGVRFPPRTLAVVQRRVAASHLDNVLLGAELHDPLNALRLGLVDELADDPVAAAHERLVVQAAHPAGAYADAKGDARGREPADLCSDAEQARRLAAALPAWTAAELKNKIARVLSRQTHP